MHRIARSVFVRVPTSTTNRSGSSLWTSSVSKSFKFKFQGPRPSEIRLEPGQVEHSNAALSAFFAGPKQQLLIGGSGSKLLEEGDSSITSTSTTSTTTDDALFAEMMNNMSLVQPLLNSNSNSNLHSSYSQDHLDRFFASSSSSSSPSSPSPNHVSLPTASSSIAFPDGSTQTSTVYHMISIKKRRVKGMNKKKLKKHKREVRNSTRYNKERRKKSGPMREKQE
ncbi:hypothetical protein HDU79_005718 [Rhizoclosmatium sp. JEL0117]|nr:hypothetical protein HDU79_005718 [Rhizoclosmatium sp. JEL0117]